MRRGNILKSSYIKNLSNARELEMVGDAVDGAIVPLEGWLSNEIELILPNPIDFFI